MIMTEGDIEGFLIELHYAIPSIKEQLSER
jgi:hypothetical protein